MPDFNSSLDEEIHGNFATQISLMIKLLQQLTADPPAVKLLLTYFLSIAEVSRRIALIVQEGEKDKVFPQGTSLIYKSLATGNTTMEEVDAYLDSRKEPKDPTTSPN